MALQGDEGTDSSLRGAKGIIRHCEEGEARRGNHVIARGRSPRGNYVIARGRSPRGNLIHQCKIASG